MTVKIVAISDTHNKHEQLVIPPCDILIHAGDESFMGRATELMDFAEWFDKQPAKHLVWIPGNHSVGFAAQYPHSLSWIKSKSPRTNVLMNSDVTLEGLKIWGSPVTPWFHDWAYNEYRGAPIKKYWDMIPSDTSIVVTHGPPHGILDVVSPGSHREQRVGCEELMKKIQMIKPKLHIFGHIHEGYGEEHFMDTHFINASSVDAEYYSMNPPMVVDV